MPLQKSFSEQGASLRSRQPWHRSKSHPLANPTRTPSNKPLAPVSKNTMNKLHAFDFHPPAPDADIEEVARASVQSDEISQKTRRSGKRVSSSRANSGQEAERKQRTGDGAEVNKVAMTPVNRLAWQDLIGTTDYNREEEETSPKERLLWDSSKDPANISPMITRRKRKRARSSSPTSSPVAGSNPTTPAVNLKKLSEALKSPHADPALELWDRFSMSGSTSKTPSGAPNSTLLQIMASSSPRPPRGLPGGKAAPSESGLRRAISCGTHWPNRRRFDRSESAPSVNTIEEESSNDSTKASMVNALLKTVDGEISSRAVAVEARSSQSPSPKKRQRTRGPERSPRKPQPPAKPPLNLTANRTGEGNTGQAPDFEIERPKDVMSDYGDDDFDDDILMELEASMVPASVNDIALESIDSAPESISRLESAPSPVPKSDDDEFADLDDEIFAAAETLIDQVDSKRTPQTGSESVEIQELASIEQQVAGSGGLQELGDDTFGDDFGADFDFEAAEVSATQSARRMSCSLPPASLKPKAIQRYLVTKVLQSDFTDRGYPAVEKILLVQVDRSNVMKTIHLRGDWIDTPVIPKSFVHVIGDFQSTGQCIIDNNQNILILHPDQLISATVVADSFTCMRRAVLQDRVKATSEATEPLVYGTILHEIFQGAMIANEWDYASLNDLIVKITEKHVEDLYKIKVPLHQAQEHLRSKMTELRHWAAAFVSFQPKPDAVVQGRNGDTAIMCVSKLLDVEEHVWSPMYGLKGNIDATVQVTMQDGTQRRTLTVPFEVKTGKNATSNHQAQTSLYNLLLADRYDIEIAYGILYYMENSKTIRIPTIRHELRHMIMQRNQLACYIRERSVQLPPMKRSTNTCNKCYAKTSCFIYHKLADNGDGETSGMKAKFDEVVKHLTPTHQEFFLKWEDLLTKEEKESQKLRRELWTMLSSEREKVGRCFANVLIEEGSAYEEADSPKINRYKYTFIKDTPAPGFSFLDSQLAVGEPIVVSDEHGHFALALGYVTTARKNRISVAVDRRLHNARIRRSGFDETNNQVFASIMEVVPEGATPASTQGKIKKPPIRYRLDKDEFSNGMATVRNNLVQIMAGDVFGSSKIRRLVVDLAPPSFKATPTQYTIAGRDSLNVDQKKAIEKVMSANDYALVLGMPGTGKTTTIAHIIRALVGQGKSVLLTSYTHSAVDNILLKLKSDNMSILRLGAPAKVHPEVQDFAILAGQPMTTFDEIQSAWHSTPIVATTCLGVSHPLFNERTFDYCIVDEASQITLPICLGPIRMARTFVLVGDHNQLPPLVQNEEARLGGLDISLFKLLSDTHPESVVNLEHQYRMCEDVMAPSNTLIYNGRLKCGTEALRHRKLDVPRMWDLQQKHYDATLLLHGSTPRSFCTGFASPSCWLRALLDPDARVRFINIDNLADSREEAKGNRIVNPTEARIVTQLVDALLTVGVPADEIGVMTHYRSQLLLLKNDLRSISLSHSNAIELHTADRFQGRDKEVVVLSLVRSNEQCNIGDLLKDWRRINVAFTRAKTKLLVVGSRETLRGSGEEEMVSQFVRLMEQREWVFDLPHDALEAHWFEDGGMGTQGTALTQLSPARSPAKREGNMRGARAPLQAVEMGRSRENVRSSMTRTTAVKTPLKRGKVTEKAVLKGKPVLRDIFNDIVGGNGGF